MCAFFERYLAKFDGLKHGDLVTHAIYIFILQ